jgi:hypothetical protein
MHLPLHQVMHIMKHGKSKLKAITLRNIPAEVARRIRSRAAQKKISLNKAVLSLLEEQTGLGAAKSRVHLYHDLDELAGSWTREEAATFDRNLAQHRKIDLEVWDK